MAPDIYWLHLCLLKKKNSHFVSYFTSCFIEFEPFTWHLFDMHQFDLRWNLGWKRASTNIFFGGITVKDIWMETLAG